MLKNQRAMTKNFGWDLSFDTWFLFVICSLVFWVFFRDRYKEHSLFQPCDFAAELCQLASLFDDHRHDDALKRNGPHGIEIRCETAFGGPEDFIEGVLVVAGKAAAELGPACQFAVDDIGEGWYGASHGDHLLSIVMRQRRAG